MTHGSLYSGIGGWLLAARWAGIDNVFTCEVDKFCNKVLDKHFPDTDRYHDIKETDFTKYAGRIDILSTSDPCQPFSFAGKRGGTTDDRFLWPFTIEAIRAIKPAYVVFENVPGFISMAFEAVASDLEAEGYTVESFIIPACALGAWHRRDRLWIIAYKRGLKKDNIIPDSKGNRNRRNPGAMEGTQKEPEKQTNGSKFNGCGKNVSDTSGQRLQGREETRDNEKNREKSRNQQSAGCHRGASYGTTEPRLGGMVNGLPPWMDYFGEEPDIPRVAKGKKDRVNRLKALGNAIYPPVAFLIFEAIKEIHENN